MDPKLIFGLLSFGFSAYAYYPYYKQIREGKARPTISTWLGWCAIDSAILLGMIAQKEVAIQMVAYVLGVLAVLWACKKAKAPLGWWWLDTVCMLLVAIAILGWVKSGDPEVAIAISVAAFLISCAPMYINVYQSPGREPLGPWLISWTGASFGMLAIPKWDITNALTPCAFFLLGTGIILLILRGRFLNQLGMPLGKWADKILQRD